MGRTPHANGSSRYDAGQMNSTRLSRLATATIAAQLVFIGGWLVLGAVEGDGYSPGRHDISDLAALTAHHATLDRLTLGISGAVTIAFALSLVPILGRGMWLLALSLPGLDNLTDVFFRLDCRAADAGCDTATATDSWHGTAHLTFFVVAALATVVAPFVLSRRMRRTDGWAGLARPTKIFGVVTIAALVASGATTGTGLQGWSQRGAAVIVCSGVAVLAWHVVQLERRRSVMRSFSPAR
jgi:hypothetical protein